MKRISLIIGFLIITKSMSCCSDDLEKEINNPTKTEAKKALLNLLAEESCECPFLPEHLDFALTNIFGHAERYQLYNDLKKQLTDSSEFLDQLLILRWFSNYKKQ